MKLYFSEKEKNMHQLRMFGFLNKYANKRIVYNKHYRLVVVINFELYHYFVIE